MKYYSPIQIENLKTIQEKVFNVFPKEKLNTKIDSLFYIPDNIKTFLSIPELRAELDRLGWTPYVMPFAFYIVQPTKGTIVHIDSGDLKYSLNVKLNHTPFIVIDEDNNSVDVVSKVSDLISKFGSKPDTKVLIQWRGTWNSDFFTFTVGELQDEINLNK